MSTWLDLCITANQASIERDAIASGISPGELERQVRLHLPSVPEELITRGRNRLAYNAVRHVARERAKAIHQGHVLAAHSAWTNRLAGADYSCRRDLWLEARDREPLPLRFEDVRPETGLHYQDRLHYLLAPRADTSHHFGLYLADAKWPIAYVAVSACDRPYMVKGLPVDGYGLEDVVVLTRMHGLPGLPGNVMSLMIKRVIRALRQRGTARIMVTAYNPLLGFHGSVYRASGFVPFTTAPVAYGYDERGAYSTRRVGTSVRLSELNTPPNVLMARGLDRATQGALSVPNSLGLIPHHEYWADVAPPVGSRRGNGGGKVKRLYYPSIVTAMYPQRRFPRRATGRTPVGV